MQMPPDRPDFQQRMPGMGQMQRPPGMHGMPPPDMPLNNQRPFPAPPGVQRPMMDQQRMMPPGQQFNQGMNQPGMPPRPPMMQPPRMDMQRPGQPMMMSSGPPGNPQPVMQGMPGQPGLGQRM